MSIWSETIPCTTKGTKTKGVNGLWGTYRMQWGGRIMVLSSLQAFPFLSFLTVIPVFSYPWYNFLCLFLAISSLIQNWPNCVWCILPCCCLDLTLWQRIDVIWTKILQLNLFWIMAKVAKIYQKLPNDAKMCQSLPKLAKCANSC